MRARWTGWMLVTAMLVVALVPASAAATSPEPEIVEGNVTFLVLDRTDRGLGVLRGANAAFTLRNFNVGDVDDTRPGGIVIRLVDTSQRTVAAVSLRARALSDLDPEWVRLSAPIDSVWGSWDYEADGYWTQARNQRINGGNCERLAVAEVTVRLTDDDPVSAVFDDIRGSCSTIRP